MWYLTTLHVTNASYVPSLLSLLNSGKFIYLPVYSSTISNMYHFSIVFFIYRVFFISRSSTETEIFLNIFLINFEVLFIVYSNPPFISLNIYSLYTLIVTVDSLSCLSLCNKPPRNFVG